MNVAANKSTGSRLAPLPVVLRFQFWLPENYDQEFMAAGAFGQYLWIDRKRRFVVAQFSTGQAMFMTQGQSGASPREREAVMRSMSQFATP